MEVKKSKYGDGSGLLAWEYTDKLHQTKVISRIGNRYAIPALKALGIDVTLANVMCQIQDPEFAKKVYKSTRFMTLERAMSELEKEVFDHFLDNQVTPILAKVYKDYEEDTVSVDAVDVYGKYLTMHDGVVRANSDMIRHECTKYLESKEEQHIWESMCKICDQLNDLFNGLIPGNWAENFKVTPNGFEPKTPIYVEDYHINP